MFLLKNHYTIMGIKNDEKSCKILQCSIADGKSRPYTNGIRLIKEWYDAGVLGEVREIMLLEHLILSLDIIGHYLKLSTKKQPILIIWIGICG